MVMIRAVVIAISEIERMVIVITEEGLIIVESPRNYSSFAAQTIKAQVSFASKLGSRSRQECFASCWLV